MSAGYLRPQIDEHNVGFWEGTRRGELCVQQCGGCGALRFPPRPMCFECRSTERDWVPVSGEGVIWSFVVPHPPLLSEFAELSPYNVIVVTLAEGENLRMVGNLVGDASDPINALDPATIEIGAPVKVVFSEIEADLVFPRWVLR